MGHADVGGHAGSLLAAHILTEHRMEDDPGNESGPRMNSTRAAATVSWRCSASCRQAVRVPNDPEAPLVRSQMPCRQEDTDFSLVRSW